MSKQNSSQDDILIQSYATYPSIIGLRANGNPTSPTSLAADDIIMQIGVRGYYDPGFSTSRANIRFKATQNWTSNANGTAITFETTADNTTSRIQRMVINQNGNLGINILNPLEKLHVNGNVRIDALAGNDKRPLFSDSNGKIVAGDGIYTVIVTPESFQRNYNLGTGTLYPSNGIGASAMIGSGATDRLVSSVNIPAGATVVEVSFYYTDNDPVNNLTALIAKNNVNSTGLYPMTICFQNTNNAGFFDISSVTKTYLNYATFSEGDYLWVTIKPVNIDGTSDGVWDNKTAVKGVKVKYKFL